MLGKCLKYDFKETFKLWWVGALVSLLSALPLSFLMFSLMNDIGDQSSFRWQVFPLMICYIGVVVGMMISLLSVYVRYYRHFFGKEAYLTFTLPVKRTTLFTSKYITALFFNIASYAILLFGMAGLMGYAILDAAGPVSLGDDPLLTTIMTALIVIVVYALFFLCTISLNTLSYFFIITFCGVYFKKYSLLAIIVAFFCLSFFGSYAMMLPMMGGMLGLFGLVGLIDANIVSMGALQGFALIGAGLLLVIVAVTALNMLLAFLSKELLERKLNVT